MSHATKFVVAPSGSGKTWFCDQFGFRDADEIESVAEVYREAVYRFGNKWWERPRQANLVHDKLRAVFEVIANAEYGLVFTAEISCLPRGSIDSCVLIPFHKHEENMNNRANLGDRVSQPVLFGDELKRLRNQYYQEAKGKDIKVLPSFEEAAMLRSPSCSRLRDRWVFDLWSRGVQVGSALWLLYNSLMGYFPTTWVTEADGLYLMCDDGAYFHAPVPDDCWVPSILVDFEVILLARMQHCERRMVGNPEMTAMYHILVQTMNRLNRLMCSIRTYMLLRRIETADLIFTQCEPSYPSKRKCHITLINRTEVAFVPVFSDFIDKRYFNTWFMSSIKVDGIPQLMMSMIKHTLNNK